MPRFEKSHLPALAGAGFGLKHHACQSAAMPHQQRVFSLGRRLGAVLDIHLLSLKLAVCLLLQIDAVELMPLTKRLSKVYLDSPAN